MIVTSRRKHRLAARRSAYEQLADGHLGAAQFALDLATASRESGDHAAQLEHLAQVFTHCLRAASFIGFFEEERRG